MRAQRVMASSASHYIIPTLNKCKSDIDYLAINRVNYLEDNLAVYASKQVDESPADLLVESQFCRICHRLLIKLEFRPAVVVVVRVRVSVEP